MVRTTDRLANPMTLQVAFKKLSMGAMNMTTPPTAMAGIHTVRHFLSEHIPVLLITATISGAASWIPYCRVSNVPAGIVALSLAPRSQE